MVIKKIKIYFWSPIFAIAIVFFILAGISWLYNKNVSRTIVQPKQQRHKVIAVHTILTPAMTPSVTLVAAQEKIPATIFPTVAPTTIPHAQPAITLTPQKTTATPTPVQVINLQLNEPDGNFNFSFAFHSGSNPCSLLNDAKNAGKIKSVTITHFGAPLNSDYVEEINSYSDNWTFTLNGTAEPKGCSNYTLSNQDTVVWKYN